MLKSKINNLIFYVLIYIIGFLSAILFWIVFRKNFISLSSISIQIDLINIISIIVNIFLVVYVTRVLSKKNEEDRIEKDMLIDYLKIFQSSLDSNINQFFNTKNLDFYEVVSKLKTFRQSVNLITNLLKKYNYNVTIGSQNVCASLDWCIRNINDYFTDTIRNSDDGFKIDEDKILIGARNRQNIEEEGLRIKEIIFDLIVLINRK